MEMFAQQARELVAQMTLEEKVSQMRYDAPAIERLGIPAYNWWNECLHGVGRSGTATVFPQPIGMAASFDESLLEHVHRPFLTRPAQSTINTKRLERPGFIRDLRSGPPISICSATPAGDADMKPMGKTPC